MGHPKRVRGGKGQIGCPSDMKTGAHSFIWNRDGGERGVFGSERGHGKQADRCRRYISIISKIFPGLSP